MKRNHTRDLAVSAVFVAIAVAGSLLQFPAFGAKCAPVQHMVDLIIAVCLGPWWAFGVAFVASLIRNLMGIGTPLAFSSCFGALLAGYLFVWIRRLPAAFLGELAGTSVIGGIYAYLVATYILGIPDAGALAYIIPFFISSAGGTILGAAATLALKKAGVLRNFRPDIYQNGNGKQAVV